MEGRRLTMVAIFMVIGIAALQISYAQKTHTVGGSIGWTIPQNGATAYTTWAASETFSVGDILVFNFATGGHTAAEVTKGAYDACTTANPITTWSTGPASVTLNSSGPHYYICTIPGHCSAGQKLSITVTGATAPAPTPTPTTAPPTPTPTPPPASSPPPTGSPTSPSPASSPPPTGSPTSPSPASSPPPTGSPTSPSPASPPSPPTGTGPAPASGTGGSGNPPAPSSASFVAATALPVTILSIAMALFY